MVCPDFAFLKLNETDSFRSNSGTKGNCSSCLSDFGCRLSRIVFVCLLFADFLEQGQPQAPPATVPAASQISDGQPQAPKVTATPASQISDGQPQAPAVTAPAATQISDGQPQAPPATAASQISDGQPQAPAASQASDGQPAAPAATMSSNMVACSGPDVLTITLADGVLKDSKGRTGYIAANYQFQFDGPPQAGAIYTSGWSVCGNGSLALGGQTTFYQCLSGDFYNLYNENWAPQCNAVTIDVLQLVDCPSS